MTMPKRQLEPQRSQTGFSTLEILVTLVVIGILTSVALPAFQSVIAGMRIKSAAFDMMAALTRTRSEAITRNANVAISPAAATWQGGWQITFTSGVAVTTISQQTEMAKDLNVVCYSGGAVAGCSGITYTTNGRVSGGAAPAIQIGSKSNPQVGTRCVGIDLTGLPRVKKGNCP